MGRKTAVVLVGVMLIVGTGGIATADSNTAAQTTPIEIASTDTSTTPGSEVTVQLSMTNTGNETVYGPAVQIVDIPDNWNITSIEADGGTARVESGEVLYLSVGPNSTVNPSVTFDVPTNASPGEYSIGGEVIQSDNVTATTSTTVSVTSPYEVSASNASVYTDEDASVTVSAINTGTESVFGLATRIHAPTGWTVEEPSGDGTFKDSTNTFVHLEIGADSNAESTVSLVPDSNLEAGTYTGEVELIRNGTDISTQAFKITVSESVKQKYDQDNDGVEINEVQTGVQDFSSGGLPIQKIQELIAAWAQG